MSENLHNFSANLYLAHFSFFPPNNLKFSYMSFISIPRLRNCTEGFYHLKYSLELMFVEIIIATRSSLYVLSVFVWTAKWQKEGDIERKMDLPSAGSFKWCEGLGTIRLKLGARNSLWVSHMGGRGLRTWPIFCCHLRYISMELDPKQSSQDSGFQLALLWDVGMAACGGLTHCATKLVPVHFSKDSLLKLFLFEKVTGHRFTTVLCFSGACGGVQKASLISKSLYSMLLVSVCLHSAW